MPGRIDQLTDGETRRWLLLARHGTAVFARTLRDLHDHELDGPSLLPGWTRRHVIAHVAYNARALARLVEWARTGIEQPMYASVAERDREIDLGVTLSPVALRNLFDHAAIHLDVEWRDLPADRWDTPVRTIQGRTVPVGETVWLRCREIWLHAFDLDHRVLPRLLPDELARRLITDIVGVWTARDTVPDVALTEPEGQAWRLGRATVHGSGRLPDLALWAAGREVGNVTWSCARRPSPPRWI